MKYIVVQYQDIVAHTTKWKHYIDHLLNDFSWQLIDISEIHYIDVKLKNIKDDDVLLLWHMNGTESFSSRIREYSILKCKIYVYYDDIRDRKETEDFERANLILSSHPYSAIEAIANKDLSSKYAHIPQGATNEFNIEFNDNPLKKILLSGCIGKNDIYASRNKLFKMYKSNDNRIDYLPHPGWKKNVGKVSRAYVGKDYAEYLNRYICGFTSSGTVNLYGYNCVVMISKVFEITAVGTLLLCDIKIHNEMKELGFNNFSNYIEYDDSNMNQIINYILDPKNRDVIDKIRKEGRKLTLSRHMAIHRSKQIDEVIEENIKNSK